MKKYSLLFFLIGSLAMAVVMTRNGATLKTPATPHGILDLELAYNSEKTSTVLNAWAPVNSIDNIAAAKYNTWLDFIFIAFYPIFLFLACKKISKSFGGGFGRAGRLIAKGALAAGCLDVLENTGMLLTLSGSGSGMVAFCTAFCSMLKWMLVILALLYILTGMVALLRARIIR